MSREPKDEPEVLIEAAAEVTGAWTTSDPEVLGALNDFHIWTPDYLQTRCVAVGRAGPHEPILRSPVYVASLCCSRAAHTDATLRQW